MFLSTVLSSILYGLGTVTDGEFCSLRSKSATRPLHIWQTIHDSKETVQKYSKKTLFVLVKCGSNTYLQIPSLNKGYPVRGSETLACSCIYIVALLQKMDVVILYQPNPQPADIWKPFFGKSSEASQGKFGPTGLYPISFK